jgi:predicted ArsR family transcriptional regulator
MDALEAVGDPELREALLYVRAQERPVTADDLAAARGVHRNVARSRLERLVHAGLLDPGYERRTGRTGPGAGRPAKTYAVVPQLDSIEFPASRYERLIGLMVDAIGPADRSERLYDVGVSFGRELARAAQLRRAKSLRTGFDRMAAAVRKLGYQASVARVDEREAVIATPTCPLRPLVRERPEVVDIDRGMWAGLAASAVDGVDVRTVRCETRNCLDEHASCEVRLTLARPRVRQGA